MKYVLIMLLLTAGSIRAQDTLVPPPRVVVKLVPFTLLNYDPTFQGAVEIRTGLLESWQGEFGYSRLRWGSSTSTSFGPGEREYWRARTEYRWYRGVVRGGYRRSAHREWAPEGNYYAIEGYFKQINVVDQRMAGRDCVDGRCAYFQRVNEPVSRFVEAFFVKYGRQTTFLRRDGKPGRVLFDAAIGIGVRGVQVTRYRGNPEPTNGWFREGGGWSGDRFDRTMRALYPDATVNLKIGYAL